MATFNFELVSPERVLFSGDVNAVVVPASEGDITVLANHAPFMSALRSGVVTVDGSKRLFVRGGFVDVSAKGLSLLAEQAVPVEEINVETALGDIKNLQEDLRDAKSDDLRAVIEAKIEGLQSMMAAVKN